MTAPIGFDNAAAYERYMGPWSQLVGEAFLGWIAPKPGGRWLDVGCGSGAFTELILKRSAPKSVTGIDPSEAQLAYARDRFPESPCEFLKADAMALPFANDAFDAAVMPLVIFFVPEPPNGVAEMARVVGPDGIVAAYAWDMPGGGFPYAIVKEEMLALGYPAETEPHPDVSRLEVLQSLWTDAGLQTVETKEIVVRRTFKDFDDYWAIAVGGPSMSKKIKEMPAANIERLKAKLRARLPAGADGRITYSARANAVKGRP